MFTSFCSVVDHLDRFHAVSGANVCSVFSSWLFCTLMAFVNFPCAKYLSHHPFSVLSFLCNSGYLGFELRLLLEALIKELI